MELGSFTVRHRGYRKICGGRRVAKEQAAAAFTDGKTKKFTLTALKGKKIEKQLSTSKQLITVCLCV